MYNQFWAIYPPAAQSALALVHNAGQKNPDASLTDDAHRAGLPVSKTGNLALITMKGPMIKEAGFWARYGIAGTRDTAQAIQAAAMDDEVESILWVIDSPGGSVDGLIDLAETVKQAKQRKPVIVQVDGMMASAALYAAAHATAIYAGPRDLIGSIGTRIMLYDYSEMFAKDGIKAIPIDTGEHKSAGAVGTEITETQKAEFQRIVDGYYADFIQTVEEGRKISHETLNMLADGRVFFANEEPLSHGLIDGIQSLDQTLSTLLQPSPSSRKTAAQAKLKLLFL